MLVIALLTILALGMVNYSQKSTKRTQTRADINMLEVSCESFKSDQGFYPTSSLVRVSQWYTAEKKNSALLYSQLIENSYIKPPPRLIGSFGGTNCFVDPYFRALNYYSTTPLLTNIIVQGSGGSMQDYNWTGGQVNRMGVDLFSYGPDGRTYCPPPPADAYFNNPALALDDVTNWK
ncbi:MAG: hypothetical protein PCFJNLEI_00244 [Verrucomicrobiae bacterium]|nr:hypothetical protein [Verrucomicrobiae bacterium]